MLEQAVGRVSTDELNLEDEAVESSIEGQS